MKRSLVVSIASLALLAGCSAEPEAPAQTTTKPTAAAAATTTTKVTLADCRRATPEQTELIAAALNTGLTLGPSFVETSPDGDVYVGANIMRGEERVSSADVWVLRNRQPYALSSDARSRSALADGRKLVDSGKRKLSAGDQYGAKVQDCVVAQIQKDNGK